MDGQRAPTSSFLRRRTYLSTKLWIVIHFDSIFPHRSYDFIALNSLIAFLLYFWKCSYNYTIYDVIVLQSNSKSKYCDGSMNSIVIIHPRFQFQRVFDTVKCASQTTEVGTTSTLTSTPSTIGHMRMVSSLSAPHIDTSPSVEATQQAREIQFKEPPIYP